MQHGVRTFVYSDLLQYAWNDIFLLLYPLSRLKEKRPIDLEHGKVIKPDYYVEWDPEEIHSNKLTYTNTSTRKENITNGGATPALPLELLSNKSGSLLSCHIHYSFTSLMYSSK